MSLDSKDLVQWSSGGNTWFKLKHKAQSASHNQCVHLPGDKREMARAHIDSVNVTRANSNLN
jgi:hypothetical protein